MRQTGKCVDCKKEIEPGEFVVLNGGALVKTKTGAKMGDKNMLGFLSVSSHFDSRNNYHGLTLADQAPSGQFEFYACSYECLANFLHKSVMHLKKLETIKFEKAPTKIIDKIPPKYIREILKVLKHPEALITDESIVRDFLSPICTDSKLDSLLEKLSQKAGFNVKPTDRIWQVAKKLERYKIKMWF